MPTGVPLVPVLRMNETSKTITHPCFESKKLDEVVETMASPLLNRRREDMSDLGCLWVESSPYHR